MRVLVCGSRHYYETDENYRSLEAALDRILSGDRVTELIHGGARGADKLGGRYAKVHNIPVREFCADWDLYGKRAGPIRNAQMLREGAPDLVIAFLAPGSRGTQNMIDQARIAGVPVEIINV